MSQKKRKPGRPKLPKGEAKTKTLPAVRFTASEIRAIDSAARVSGQSVSEWIRGLVRNALHNITPAANLAQGSSSNDPRRIRAGRRSFDSGAASA